MCHILSRVHRGRRRVTLLLSLIFVQAIFKHISNENNIIRHIQNNTGNYYTFTHHAMYAMKYKICETTAAVILYID